MEKDGKYFLKCTYELVLTAMDDYVTKICFGFMAFNLPYLMRKVFFKDLSVSGEL